MTIKELINYHTRVIFNPSNMYVFAFYLRTDSSKLFWIEKIDDIYNSCTQINSGDFRGEYKHDLLKNYLTEPVLPAK